MILFSSHFSVTFQLQTQFQLSYTLLCHEMPLYPQRHENARELLKESPPYPKMTLV